MIISASRRTDIPTYYSDWFMQRIKEGYVLARNPMNAHQVSRISLNLFRLVYAAHQRRLCAGAQSDERASGEPHQPQS